jgi:hypothetical protein
MSISFAGTTDHPPPAGPDGAGDLASHRRAAPAVGLEVGRKTRAVAGLGVTQIGLGLTDDRRA